MRLSTSSSALVSALSLGLAAASLTATFGQAQGRLIGFTGRPAVSARLTFQALCNPATDDCASPLPSPTDGFAGGACYDPRRRSVWHTQGTRLVEVRRDTCDIGCVTAAARALGPRSQVGGLAFDVARELIYQIESAPGAGVMSVYTFGTAPCPTATPTCTIALANGRRLGAIAYDGEHDLIYVAESSFAALNPQNRIRVYRASNPCAPLCVLSAPNCSTIGGVGGALGAIRAMAYDECSDTLFISDGRQTNPARVRVSSATSPCPTLIPGSCCALNSSHGELWFGFDTLPVLSRRLGSSCLPRGACRPCASMELSEIGAPVVGNQDYGFAIENAPTGGTAWLILNFGGCQPIPLFCGQLLPSIATPLIVVGPRPLNGLAGCDGAARFGLPLPNDYGLCNRLLCVQGLVLCPTTNGVGLTNGLVVPLGV